MRVFVAATLMFIFGSVTGSADAGIVSLYIAHQSYVNFGSEPGEDFMDLEHSGTHRDDAESGAYSQTGYDFRDVNGQAVFDWSFKHFAVDYGSGAQMVVYIEVDEDTPYSISGNYAYNGADYIGITAQLDQQYGDYKTTYLTDAQSRDPEVTSGLFDLSRSNYPYYDGKNSGILSPGSYSFYTLFEIVSPTAGTASAEGNLHFTLGAPAAVPEPSSLILAGLGFCGALAGRRKLRGGLRQGC